MNSMNQENPEKKIEHFPASVFPVAPSPPQIPPILRPLPLMPDLSDPYGSIDDALTVWLVFSSPFSEFKRVWPTIREFQNRRPEGLVPRFLEIMSSPEVMQRAAANMKGDLMGFRVSTVWTKHETFSLFRLVRNNKRCNAQAFLTHFPMLFHPCRTVLMLNQTYEKFRLKEGGFDQHLAQYKTLVQKTHAEARKEISIGFPGDYEDPSEEVKKILEEECKKEEKPQKVDDSLDDLRHRAQDLMHPKSVACLIGPGNIRNIRKCKVFLGRASPKCRPDIDLSDLKLQHISRRHLLISLAKDINFYARIYGSKGLILNGRWFKKDTILRLRDGDVIDIGGACFVFLENMKIIAPLRAQLSKH